MTTFVGTQSEFGNAIKELLELDYDAVEAYQVAIEKVESNEYKAKLSEFKRDHERHIEELTKLLEDHDQEAPAGPSSKQWLTKGKVFLANIFGDKAILTAMKTNEDDTNSAYEKMSKRDDQWEDAKAIIQRGYEDEKRHKAWIENIN